ncbi:AAA family ATPase [Actinopolymorpha sp. B9G3]|uniref:AAA family ATPase n=1 Tax=Actinopolymorpha sp. B9G3 TaxID=3158970 RepID=UPI0032D94D1A
MFFDTDATLTGCHDFRDKGVDHLRYPVDSVVVLVGIPGAGKSTLLHRLSGTAADEPLPEQRGGVRIVDSEQERLRWQRYMGSHAYAWWRPAVHAVHYGRVWAAIRHGGPVMVPDCGTRPWVRSLLGRLVAAERRVLHLVLLDATPEQARAGQRARGRSLGVQTFQRHCRRWGALLAAVEREGDPAHLVPGARSAVVLDRRSAERLRAVSFTGVSQRSDYGVVAELRSGS